MGGLTDEAARRLRSNPAAVVAVAVLSAIVVLTWLGPWISPNNSQTLDWLHIAARPGMQSSHWFGTDRLGRDLFVRTLAGTRVSIAIGLAASVISLLVGVSYGAIAGYIGGRTDHLMMRLIEILSGLPLIFAIGAVGWLTMARIVRGQTLSIRQREFIEAAIASGAGTGRIIARHVVPNVIGPVIVFATLTVPQIILFESFLSFLGLGIQEPGSSLGTLIAEGAAEMEAAPWILLVPGSVLALLLLCLNIFGDGLRDALDVKDG